MSSDFASLLTIYSLNIFDFLHLDPAPSKLFWFTPTLPSCSTRSLAYKLDSPDQSQVELVFHVLELNL
jgi:hypothetical protein